MKYVVDRVASNIPKYVEREDLLNAAALGLFDALEKFDAAKGTKFETYAIQRIRGKIIDELRKIQIKPRALSNGDGNKPFYTNVSLNQPIDHEDGYLLYETIPNEEESPDDTTVKNDEKKFLIQAIKELPEKARLVITLYYYESLTYKEIAKILNITVSRVSQIHSQVVKVLKENLQVLGEHQS